MLSSETITTIQATIPLLETVKTGLTKHFYKRLFHHHPELQDVFNMSHQRTGGQPAALFDAVLAYARNIENLEALLPAVERIAHKHTSFLVKPEQYDVVGHHLIETIRELAGEAATPEVLQAWSEAYQLLAQVFIGRENTLYEQQAQSHGGWEGTRSFVVSRKEKESALITSFYLEAEDGQPILGYKPGQYLGIQVKPVGSKYQEIRQYSLSDASNGQYYRISVKRENGDEKGVVSNHLHDHVQVGDKLGVMPPAGDFYLETQSQSPVVLLSGGVGFTPLMAMLNTLIQEQHQGPILWLHGCENSEHHALAEDIQQKATQHENLKSYTWYNQPTDADVDASSHTGEGVMNLEQVREDIDLPHTHFYFCGPLPFMQFVNDTLKGWRVEEHRIHYEVFGPHSSL
ncbi:NO-inducible flavohemoprotein [Parendozoicomonas sp. Alg238-R29]|uniref:NO-inducible flavohemoprotein n=1 Tax=Parendozoicomonas sp. Alg238-R29 TaxID=2993446 RepID=UPI00248DEA76|nr:NO-inducible flavohemoprotein [Parendozoicomonas sp. Alg238-R29]